ncbi:MAG: N-acetylneuraminate synthase [Alphaproteobacteria bacterium]|jgi:N-acetylneuraminate synthase
MPINNFSPYIIAEMSGNHNQSLQKALELVEAAANSGAHAIKLQTYTADTITMNCATDHFMINDEKSLWHGRKLHDLYQEAHTPWDWHKPIFDKAKSLGIDCFSSPFDFTAVDFLEQFDPPFYKVASFEITHIPLIKKCAQTGRPLIISTGMATKQEIQEAYDTAIQYGASSVTLLKCTSQYPADASDANLNTMQDMQASFPKAQIGLSDHTMGIGVAIAATCMGARMIEKHFTLNRADGGVDSAFSLEPHELKMLVSETKKAAISMGQVKYGGTDNEANSRKFRQSIWINGPLKAGDILTEDNIKICRPNVGLSPNAYYDILGKKINQNVDAGVPVTENLIAS